jgi:hypothetical protein
MPSTTGPRTAPASPSIGRSRRRRSVEAGLFAAVWITAGHLLPLSSNGYLLLGIPLSLAFQVIVRRRPPRELFTAGTSRFTVDRRGAAPAVALAVVPGWYAARSLTGHDWVSIDGTPEPPAPPSRSAPSPSPQLCGPRAVPSRVPAGYGTDILWANGSMPGPHNRSTRAFDVQTGHQNRTLGQKSNDGPGCGTTRTAFTLFRARS